MKSFSLCKIGSLTAARRLTFATDYRRSFVAIIDHRTACTFLFLLACSTALGYLFRSTRRVFLCRHRTSGVLDGIVICSAHAHPQVHSFGEFYS
jgi:hypothetical protein